MTWLRCLADAKFFVSSTSLLDEIYPEHNEAIAGDSLFSIQLNHKWRRIIAGLLSEKFRRDDSTISLDNEDLLNNLLLDLYNAEALNMDIVTRLARIDIGANRTTTGTSFALVTGTNLSHTPTKSNMKIRVYNVAINNSGATFTEAEIRFNAVAGADNGSSRMTGATGISTTIAATFTGLSVGVAHDIALYWKVTGGTGTMFRASDIIYDIEEWDD